MSSLELTGNEKPEGAQALISGAWYKINKRGQVCIHNNYEWVTSTRGKADTEIEIERYKRMRILEERKAQNDKRAKKRRSVRTRSL